MTNQDHSYLDDMDADGVVVITLPSHVPVNTIDEAIERISRTDFGVRATYTVEGHRIAVRCEPMAFVDSAVEHLVDVVRAILTGKYRPRPDEGPVDDGMPF
jgi:hypothetical protein